MSTLQRERLSDTEISSATDKAIYLFGFGRTNLLPKKLEGAGIDGSSPLFVKPLGSIAPVLSMVSLEEFAGPEAESRMQDLDWIGPRALQHEKAVEEIMRYSPVFPARFGTIFLSFDGVERIVSRHQKTISEFLDLTRDRREWAVKAFLVREKAREEFVRASLAAKENRLSSSPGARYLQEKRIRVAAERELNVRVGEICSGVLEKLSARASDRFERKVLPSSTTEVEGDMILNWAFLVPDSDITEFHAIVELANARYSAMGLSFHTSGPWPPYSFTPALPTEPDR